MWEAVWGGYQHQPWCNGIILTQKVTQNSKIGGNLGLCNGIMVHPCALETAYQAYQYLKHIVYVQYGCEKQPQVDIASNITLWHHFHSTSDPKILNLGPTWPVYQDKGAPMSPWDNKTIPQTLLDVSRLICEAVWGGYQPQPWHNGIISTPQVTQKFKIWGQLS